MSSPALDSSSVGTNAIPQHSSKHVDNSGGFSPLAATAPPGGRRRPVGGAGLVVTATAEQTTASSAGHSGAFTGQWSRTEKPYCCPVCNKICDDFLIIIQYFFR